MSSSAFGGLKRLTVTAGDTHSNYITFREMQDAYIVGLFGLSTQDSKTLTIEVSRDLLSLPGDVPTNWYTLQDGATLANIPVPGVGKAAFYAQLAGVSAFRIAINSTSAGDITIEASKSSYAPSIVG